MSDPNYEAKLRIFSQLRMHPWIPEHKLFIDAQLAMMDIMEPEKAKTIRKEYENKMEKYLSEQPKEETQSVDPIIETPVETVPVTETPVAEKPKRGRKPKLSTPS